MTHAPSSLELAVREGHRFLLPVSVVNLAAGLAIVAFDSSDGWRILGAVMAIVGFGFLVYWARNRNPAKHPLVTAVRDRPSDVRWVHIAIEASPIGAPDRAVLHVGLQEGAPHAIPVEEPALAEAALMQILASCPQARRVDHAQLNTLP